MTIDDYFSSSRAKAGPVRAAQPQALSRLAGVSASPDRPLALTASQPTEQHRRRHRAPPRAAARKNNFASAGAHKHETIGLSRPRKVYFAPYLCSPKSVAHNPSPNRQASGKRAAPKPKSRLALTYPIDKIESIDAAFAAKLKAARIRTTTRLLEAAKDPRGRQALIAKTGIDGATILKWANAADRMRIKGVGGEYAELLQAAGVDTVRELKYRNPAKLAQAMAEANARKKLVRLLPSEKLVKRWIAEARALPLKISY